MIEAAHIIVSGVVQGVGYRFWAERTAQQLGLVGWVRNLDDGRVEILVEGEPNVVQTMIDRCRRGPRSAEVSEVSATKVAPSGATGFEVKRTAVRPDAKGST